MKTEYKWTTYYMELADTLLEYKENRSELINKIIKVYDNINMKLPRLSNDSIPKNIDPFTIFGLFNKQILDKKRERIACELKNEFNLKSSVPSTFEAIPKINNLSATFYNFNDENINKSLDNLWNLFEMAIKYADNTTPTTKENLIISYNTVLPQKQVKWNITIALYWIRPYTYVSLDSTNRSFLKIQEDLSSDVTTILNSIKDNPPEAEIYLNLCDKCLHALENNHKYHSIPELSDYSYQKKTNNTNMIGDCVSETNYWLLSPGKNASKWNKFYENNIMAIGFDDFDLNDYPTKEKISDKIQEIHNDSSKHTNDVLALWEFFNEIKENDIIFVKKDTHTILGYGIVKSGYRYDTQVDDDFYHVRSVDWKIKGNYHVDENLIIKTLTNITKYPSLVNNIKELFDKELFDNLIDDIDSTTSYSGYKKDEFLDETFISEYEYDTLRDLIKFKKNVIIQGAPGVGKTYISKRLAYSIMGVKDKSRVELVQFHQSYSYEDFIIGYRPSNNGFILKTGIFYDFCKKAALDFDNDYFFIIDEINRGNLSKIFGELFMLIESDKRGIPIQLLYNNELFEIPENLYIIGLMNTADRSLAILDYALRRRFAFYTLKPAFNTDNFKKYSDNIDNELFNKIIHIIVELNSDISNDELLGEGFCIGHSYFSNLEEIPNLNKHLKYVINYEIIPLIREYWFDDEDKVELWSNKLRSVIM